MFSITAFLAYVFTVSFTPGPNTIMSMVNGSKFGYKKSFKFLLGISSGFFILMILSSYFNLILFNVIPKIKFFMSILGAVYMTYLAIKIMKSKDTSKTNDLDDNKTLKLNSFINGFTMQFVNPKAILYGITVISNFIIPYYNSNTALILFSLLLTLLGFMATSSWALFGSIFNKFLSEYRKPFNIAMGLLLIYSAISILNS